MLGTMLSTMVVLATLARGALASPADDAKALGDRFKAAVESGSVDAVLALYADDARVIYPGQGAEARGKAALRALLERDLPDMRAGTMTQKSSDAIALDDSHILNVGVWEAHGSGPDGRPTTAIVRTTELLVKEGDVWRYVVDHASIGVPPPPPDGARKHRRQ